MHFTSSYIRNRSGVSIDLRERGKYLPRSCPTSNHLSSCSPPHFHCRDAFAATEEFPEALGLHSRNDAATPQLLAPTLSEVFHHLSSPPSLQSMLLDVASRGEEAGLGCQGLLGGQEQQRGAAWVCRQSTMWEQQTAQGKEEELPLCSWRKHRAGCDVKGGSFQCLLSLLLPFLSTENWLIFTSLTKQSH